MSYLARLMGVSAAVCLGSVCAAQITVTHGTDAWVAATPTAVTFGPPGVIPPIPPSFFGPGSDPFTGTVTLGGSPLDPSAPTDTIVQRNADASLPSPGSPATVPIQMVALQLVSVLPITVTYNGGLNPEQWDLRVILAGAPLSAGAAALQEQTTTTGTIQYNVFQFSPQFTFTPTGGGPPHVFSVPPVQLSPVLSAPPANFVTAPPPLAIPGTGPDMFPTTNMSLAEPGGAFTLTLQPARFPDCNGNGVPDAQDISGHTSLDTNMNGVPDECEMTLSCRQLSFPDDLGGYVQRFSAWGELGVRAVELPAGAVLWFNATIDGTWKVKNLPLIEIDGQGGFHTYLVRFDLGGVGPVTGVQVVGKITTGQLDDMHPPAGAQVLVPVTELDYRVGGRNTATGPLQPGTAANFLNPATLFLWTEEHRSGVNGVDEAKDGCAQGGGARSLDWMNHLYCLGFPADCDTAQKVYDKLFMLMGTSSPGGTGDNANVAGLRALIHNKMLDDVLMVTLTYGADGNAIADALHKGKDVMGLIGWTGPGGGGHVITITGITVCGPFFTIHYRDDAPQGDNTADSDDTKTSGLSGGMLTSLPANTFDGIITICPTMLKQVDALLKWIDGDGSGGMVEGAGPILDDGITNGSLTPAQLALLKKYLANARSIARYLCAQLQASPSTPQSVLDAAVRIKADLDSAWASVQAYMADGMASHLTDARDQLSNSFHTDQHSIHLNRDCNANGIDDAADIANGRSLDTNANGIPDECEALVTVLQTSWPDFDGGFVQRFSRTAYMEISYVEPPEDTILWFNASVNGVWVVQNLPLGEVDGQGTTQRMDVIFDLANTPGVSVATLPVTFKITLDQQTAMPADPPVVVPVTEKIVRPGYSNPDEITGPLNAPVPVNFANPADPIPWERIRRRDFGMVDEVIDGCAPGAGGRCLDWMNHLYCLGFPADCDTAQEIYAKLYMLMHTQPRTVDGMGHVHPGGTTIPNIDQGLRDLIEMKGLTASMMVSLESALDPNYMATRLKQGKDVIALIQWLNPDGSPNGGHVITITGMTICGPKIEIEYVDDATGGDDQGDGDPDFGTKTAMLVPVPGGGYTVQGLDKNAMPYFIQVCPSPFKQENALQKWIDGDGSGGMVEGVGPLIDRILGGHMPSAAEKANLRKWACNAKDVACYLKESVMNSNAPQAVKDAAARAKAAAAAAKDDVLAYLANMSELTPLSAAAGQLGVAFHDDLHTVRHNYDCNDNNIDDLQDLAAGTLHDANHDGVPDECACQTPTITFDATVELASVSSGAFDRCITFEFYTPSSCPAPAISLPLTVHFVNRQGAASGTIPCGSYSCVTARDRLHTLARTLDASELSTSPTGLIASLTGPKALRGGNLNDDAFIDVLDFGGFISRLGRVYADGNTPCGYTVPGGQQPPLHADFDGDGDADLGDYTFISNQIFAASDPLCCGGPLSGGPVTDISVWDLAARGDAESWEIARTADLNHDRRINAADMAFLGAHGLPACAADFNGVNGVSVEDIFTFLAAWFEGVPAADFNDDHRVSVQDIFSFLHDWFAGCP